MMQGVTTFSPVRDKHGRRLLIFQIGKMDIKLIKDIGLDIFYKMSCLFYDWLTLDENVQANGVVFIADYTGMTLQTFNLIADRSRQHDFMSYFQHALPVRTKSMNAYNEPAFFDVVYAFFSPFLSKKLKERFHIRGRSLVKIYEEVGYEGLPEEYLPDDYEGPKAGTMKQMQDEMRRQVATPEFRRYVRELSSGKYGVDKNRIPAKSEAEGSYRKLNVD
ncbi:alpha-tocopherol transfer protein-like [Mya arenaria]|uniref:alpha-tocopherol transfer protein-like n=1 Tax=Mya arenaria TaxID=6604 RepID=UPI0022E63727|nr:alpha-tocopherol transfer protein-like [Mya arenaria]